MDGGGSFFFFAFAFLGSQNVTSSTENGGRPQVHTPFEDEDDDVPSSDGSPRSLRSHKQRTREERNETLATLPDPREHASDDTIG